MSKFVVLGVSGNTGKVVADTLLSGGNSVRVVVRDPAKGEAWASRGAEVAVADATDVKALTGAFQGADGAYVLIPPHLASNDLGAYQAKVIEALSGAIAASRIPHVVLLSSVAAQHASGTGPIVAVHRAEQAFEKITGTKFSFLRAAYFMENIGGSLSALDAGILPSFTPASFAFDMIATRDIGRLGAELLVEGPPKANDIVELSAGKLSMGDAAAALSTIVGKEIKVAEAPVDSMATTLAGYGFPPALAALYEEMTKGLLSGHVAFDGKRRVQGRTTLAEVLGPLVKK